MIDVTKVRWAVKDTSIVTADEFPYESKIVASKGQLSVAHNVGKSVAYRVVKLHNAELAMRESIAAGISDE
jgi:phosphotransferase system IIB component